MKKRILLVCGLAFSMLSFMTSCDHVKDATAVVGDKLDDASDFFEDAIDNVTEIFSFGSKKKNVVDDDDYDYDSYRSSNDEVVEVVAADYRPDYSWLSYREVTMDDLEDKNSDELRLMRNWIFARHGYIFKSRDLSEYFSQFPWYEPLYDNVTPYLNDVELYNIETIKRYE